VADEILADVDAGLIALDPGRIGFAGLPDQLQRESVSYAQWVRLDDYERQTAPVGRIRRKLPYHEQMLAIAHGDAGPAT
jgi:ferredoxin--NADP+ reductase